MEHGDAGWIDVPVVVKDFSTGQDHRRPFFIAAQMALGRLFDEQKRNVPVRNQATIEYLLAVAEAEKRRFLSQHARKGGQAKKTDALQQRS